MRFADVHGPVLAHFVDTALKPLVVGEDPREIDRLWHKMLFRTYKLGVQGVQPEGIAGIDIALWDILGKIAGMPCSRLWGGPVRDQIRTYCHLGGGRMEDFYETRAENAGRFADLARPHGGNAFAIPLNPVD